MGAIKKKSPGAGKAFNDFQFFFLLAVPLTIYYRLALNPVLYYTAQEPVFFFNKYFFLDFIKYPGGLVDWLAALLSQFFYYSIPGSIILALLATFSILLFNKYLKNIANHPPSWWSALPLFPLLLYSNDYESGFSYIIALAAGLLWVFIFSKLATAKARILFFAIAGTLLYFLAGFAFLFFTLLAVLYEILRHKNFILALIYLFIGLVLPWVSAMLFFLVTPKQAFLHPILNVLDNNFAVSLAVLYPLVVLFLFLSRMVKHKLERTAFDIVIVSVILIMAIGLALLKSDAMAKTFWKINYYAQNRNWEKLVDVYEKHLTANPQIQFQVNRALCLLDKIGDEFFRYNTTYNRRTFFLIDEELLSSPLVYSDYFFDLHHFVESKHWAYEALSVKGETGRILQRLAEVSLIEGRFKLAQEYLTKLTTTIPFKKWAQHYLPLAQNPDKLAADEFFGPLIKKKINSDFLTFIDKPEHCLKEILAQQPENAVARDFYFIELLASKRLAQFAQEALKFADRKRAVLPRHYQEALLFYYTAQTQNKFDLKQFNMSADTFKRFNRFKAEYVKNKSNKLKAKSVLAKDFGGTYWYYYLFADLPGSV